MFPTNDSTIAIAVVLINYNSFEDTLECIKSLSSSTVLPFIVLVDNNSTNQAEILIRLPEYQPGIHVILNKENVGFGNANNIGIDWIIANTNAEYILLLNNDTIVQNDTLSVLHKDFEKDDSIGLTTCKITYFSNPDLVWYGGGEINLKRGKQKTIDFQKKASPEGANKSRYVSFASGCAMMFKRKVLKELGGFDSRLFMYVEDLELCLRLQKNNYKIWYSAETKILHKVHASTTKDSRNLPALHPKNPKLAFYVYHINKNLLLTMYRHLRGIKWLRFLAYYSLFSTYKTSTYIYHSRTAAIRSYIKALRDFGKEKSL